MSRLEAEDNTRLHSHDLGADGAPRMTERVLSYLDTPRSPSPRPLSFADAWARLRAEEPPLAAAVAQTIIHKLTVRDAAPVLGVSFKTVARHKRDGIAALVVWTGLPAPVVARQVCDLTA
jgi:hypothetical protein